MAILKDHSRASSGSGPPPAAAWEENRGQALLRELEAMGEVFSAYPPGPEREAALEAHRRRLQQRVAGVPAPAQPRPAASDAGIPVARPAAAPARDGPPAPAQPAAVATAAVAPAANPAVPIPASGAGPMPPRKRLSARDIEAKAGRWRIAVSRLRNAARPAAGPAAATAAVALLFSLTMWQHARISELWIAIVAFGHRSAELLAQPAVPSRPPARPPRPWPPVSGVSPTPPRSAVGQHETAGASRPPRSVGPAPSTPPRQHAAPARSTDRPDALAAATTPATTSPASQDGGPVEPPRRRLQVGSRSYQLATLYDAGGAPAGWRLRAAGPRAEIAAAFDELLAWGSTHFGEAREQPSSAPGGEWLAGARWSPMGAEAELVGRSRTLRDSPVWSVDLADGAVRAVDDAEVSLTYRRTGAQPEPAAALEPPPGR